MEKWLDRISLWLFFVLDGIELIVFLFVLTAVGFLTAWTLFDTSLSAVEARQWWVFVLCAGVFTALLALLVRHIRTRRFYWLIGLFLVAVGWNTYYILNL